MITILYAFRNKDAHRVRLSLLSLQKQNVKDFEVLFVDYGSDVYHSNHVKEVVSDFDFVTYYYVGHPGLLWNKSKALNYGIKQAKEPYILTLDVDVILAPNGLERFRELCNESQFHLFKIGYLSESVSANLMESTSFEELSPSHVDDTFGIGLFPKKALQEVHGLDEFYHFYGSEDEDLNGRLKNAGYQLHRENQLLFLHLWHKRYPKKKDDKLSQKPRLYNVMRINQRHFLRQELNKVSVLKHQDKWGQCHSKKNQEKLQKEDVALRLPNIDAFVKHFLYEELPTYKGKIVKVVFFEASPVIPFRKKVSNFFKKSTQPYMSLKQVNDLVLQRIVFSYRHHNYSFTINPDLNEIQFIIEL